MKALITGASGFIGAHLAQALVLRGDRVKALVRRTSRCDGLEPLGVKLAQADVTDAESLRSVVAGVEVVYHLAGLVKAHRLGELLKVNQQGVHNVAAACAACATPPVLVLVSSLAAAGPAPAGRERTELDPPAPVSKYGRSKRAGELAAEAWCRELPLTIVRPAIVFGERDPNTLGMFRPIARSALHVVLGRQPRRFSLIHAADLADALVLAAERGSRVVPSGQADPRPASGYYFAAGSENPTYAELGRLIGRALGRQQVRVVRAPEWLGWCAAGLSEFVARVRGRPSIINLDKICEATAGSWTCSIERARRELGFAVRVPLAARLRQTADWYARQGWL